MTPAEKVQLQTLMALKEDFPRYATECLKIKTKAGATIPLVLNKAQRFVHEKLEEQRRLTGKIRALVLKARQQGFSTYIGGRYYHRASLNHGVSVYILTHEQGATDNLFNMVDRYHNNTPLKPSTSAANAKELVFNLLDGGYAVGTAGSKAVGRSKTIQLFHGSEAAFWPNAKDHFAGVVQAIPDLPGTEVIIESTANGIGGEFHERWQQAEAGLGDYIAIFVPWFWSDEYRRPVPEKFDLSDEEQEYRQRHDLDMSQMVWRRAKLAELKDPMLFMQEYPATAAEAFQTTGHDSFIKPDVVLAARKLTLQPLGPLVYGADPARFGDDRFSLVGRRGRAVVEVESRAKIDTVAAANWLKMVIDKNDPAKMFIDVGGLGAGCYDLLVSFGEKYAKICEAINFGSEPQSDIQILDDGSVLPGARNRRAEMWMRLRDWLMETGGADIPDKDALQADLCGPGYSYDSNQRILLESKESMKKRGIRSPDEGDALALTFASPVYERRPEKHKSESYNQHTAARRAPTGWMSA